MDLQTDGNGPQGLAPRADSSATAGVSRAIVQLMARYSGRHREALQRVMRDEAVAAVAAVEAVTGRRVRVALADVAPEEGVAHQLFLFDGR